MRSIVDDEAQRQEVAATVFGDPLVVAELGDQPGKLPRDRHRQVSAGAVEAHRQPRFLQQRGDLGGSFGVGAHHGRTVHHHAVMLGFGDRGQ